MRGWQWLKTLWPHLLEFRTRVVIAVLCLVGAKLASVSMPFLLKHQVDALNSGADSLNSGVDSLNAGVAASVAGSLVENPDWWLQFPLMLLLAYGAARLMSVLFGELRDLVFGRVTERAMRRLALRVFRHLHALSLSFHLDRQTGALQRDIERGVSGISFLLRFMVFNILPTLLELLLVIGLLLANYPPVFAIITALAIVLYVGFSFRVTEWRTRYVREANKMDSETHARALDSLLNFETVKYFNAEEREARSYDEALAKWEEARQSNRKTLFALNGGQALIISTAMLSMLMFAAYYVLEGRMTLGDFTLINAFMFQLFLPLNFLGFVYRELKASMANIERMFDLLEEPVQQLGNPDRTLTITRGEVEFNQVNFAYRPDRPILQGLSLNLPAGKTTAVVGSSGAGKSTLTRLLFGLYEAEVGEIRIDGQALSDVSSESLRSQLGIVPQDTVLFNDSLRNNLLYANPDSTEDDLKRVLAVTHLDRLVAHHKEGMDVKVGERGLKLSGGEKQRVSIARMLLKQPSIMVFDEATSSLDSHTEQEIMSEIQRLSQGHTTLIIAHRLSTIIHADQILVLEQGSVVEQGTHAELLSSNGAYANLWRAQQDKKQVGRTEVEGDDSQ